MKKLLKYFAKRSHNIQVQLLLATMYGLLDIFGVTGAFAIIIKARKLAKPKAKSKPVNRVTV